MLEEILLWVKITNKETKMIPMTMQNRRQLSRVQNGRFFKLRLIPKTTLTFIYSPQPLLVRTKTFITFRVSAFHILRQKTHQQSSCQSPSLLRVMRHDASHISKVITTSIRVRSITVIIVPTHIATILTTKDLIRSFMTALGLTIAIGTAGIEFNVFV